MDPGDFAQFVVVVTLALATGRLGLALARVMERRWASTPGRPADTDDRLRAVEDECLNLRREVAELQERQDFAERALLHDPARVRPAAEQPAERVVTPR